MESVLASTAVVVVVVVVVDDMMKNYLEFATSRQTTASENR